ncbi:hypothetical protein [Aureispira sp. CCB-E]|uniref:hypothetical protein n=1 Tax=Aureispira sp. CCB-E TaxID=3051121 RepID=UPI0028684501|nr:hypothetical protein [Aureispira sp. CCB-E]WMX13403.1 hypothetical protein QP953_21385 [Aureispira sp. CCB-E]
MKYIIIAGLIGLFSVQSVAQDCLYEKNEVDAFDNKVERLTEAIVIAQKVKRDGALPLRKVMAQFRQIGEKRYFVLKFPVTMVMSPTFTDNNARNQLILLLENKEKIKLPLADLMRNVEDKVEFRYATDFVLKESTIALLKQYRITDIRVGMKNNTFDVHLREGAAGMLMDALECIE